MAWLKGTREGSAREPLFGPFAVQQLAIKGLAGTRETSESQNISRIQHGNGLQSLATAERPPCHFSQDALANGKLPHGLKCLPQLCNMN